MVSTLESEPSHFHERNRGVTLLAESCEYDQQRHLVMTTMSDPTLHGIADGGHTIDVLLKTARNGGDAFVRFNVMTGADADQIADITGGLNTSQQVDTRSLINLRGDFEPLKKVLEDKSYADKIGYKMNGRAEIDVKLVLAYMTLFDCSVYNANAHPAKQFGRKEEIVRQYAQQAKKDSSENPFHILITKAVDILELRDQLEKRALDFVRESRLGNVKAGKKPGRRIGGSKSRNNHLLFLGEVVKGGISLGWIMPMLAGFRANVSWNDPKGTFSWKVPLPELLDRTIERLVTGIKEIYQRENERAEYVGRDPGAYRQCYDTVAMGVLECQVAQGQKNRA